MNLISYIVHSTHILAAGIWLGGLVFTATVVSPAFKRMNWTAAERIAVRSEVGRQYAKVARVNVVILVIAAIADWLAAGFSSLAVAELACLALIVLLSELHARFYAPRLAQAAREQLTEQRSRLLRVSVGVSMLNLLASIVLVALSIVPKAS